MENIIILLACVVMTTAAGNYKLFKMEKSEKVEVREFEHSSFTIAELPEHNNKQTTAYHVENPGPELGETQKCGGVKPVNGTPILPS
jgi:hypothetical protein